MREGSVRIRAAASLVAALMILAACSDQSSPVGDDASSDVATSEEQPSPSPSEEPSPSPEEAEDADESEDEEATDTVTLEVWFAQGTRLAPASVTVESTPRVGAAALEALLAGPPPDGGKLTSAIPADTKINGLAIEDGTATVDLSAAYESGGGTASMGMRLGQVTFTLTQFPSVKRVAFEVDGKLVKVFSNEGLVIEKPLTRADFEDFSPPIVVGRPLAGAEVSSPVTVAGTANVFEANVSIRIVDAGGEVLAETFTTATCGSGCRGDFSERVAFEVDEPTEVMIMVFEESAEDGSVTFPVKIPVTLVP